MTATPQSIRLKSEHRGPIAESEYYKEPRWAVDALLDSERFIGDVLDPCCGSGTVPDAFADRGFETYGSDIVDRADGRFAVCDFFDGIPQIDSVGNVVSAAR